MSTTDELCPSTDNEIFPVAGCLSIDFLILKHDSADPGNANFRSRRGVCGQAHLQKLPGEE